MKRKRSFIQLSFFLLCLYWGFGSVSKAQDNLPEPPRISPLTQPDVALPREPLQKISAKDWGFLPQNTPEANGDALEKLFKYVNEKSSLRVEIPTGTYYVKSERPNQIYIQKAHDIILEGKDVHLIFKEHEKPSIDKPRQGGYIVVDESQRIQIRGITLSWDWEENPLGGVAKVTKINPKGVWLQMVYEDIPGSPQVAMGREWDPAIQGRSLRGLTLVKDKIQKTEWSDQRNLFVAMNNGQFTSKDIGKQTNLSFKVKYSAQGIDISSSSDITIEEVTIHSVPRTAYAFWGCKNYQVIGCKDVPPEGTHRFRSSGESFFEMHNSEGVVVVEGNQSSYNADDTIHLSDSYIAGNLVRDPLDPKTLIVDPIQYFINKHVIRAGDEMEFKNGDFSQTDFSAKLVSFKWEMNVYPGPVNNRCRLTFDKEIPEYIKKNSLIFNKRLGESRFFIRNNTFENGYCFGIFCGNGNGIIENNTITGMGYPGLTLNLLLRWERWAIGPGPKNVIVRNNRILNCNTAQRQPACVIISTGYDPRFKDYAPSLNRGVSDIEFTGNTVQNTTLALLAIWSAERVSLKNNKFINGGMEEGPASLKDKGVISVKNSAHINFEKNLFREQSGAHLKGIVIDSECQNVLATGWDDKEP